MTNRFSPFVKECWNSFDVNGKKAYVIKEKMKLLKEKLRVWNKEVFGWVDLSIDNTVKGLNELDSMVGEGAVRGRNHKIFLGVDPKEQSSSNPL